ncbi:hypothetical protein Tco_1016620 [Tanacetum coccineum]|uniref:UBN2 domain-containing protein n=1 Tax=Tanacetum coccineum TaxID=301880 RepID=A0ABQ5FPD6_9ASTR
MLSVRKFLRALPLKRRAKVTTIEKAKDLATLPLDELIGNLKVYEMILDNDGLASKTTKENVKSLAPKSKVTREQTSDDSDSKKDSEDIDKEEESEAFNLMARNFCKFFRKGNRFGRDNRFGSGTNRFGRGMEIVWCVLNAIYYQTIRLWIVVALSTCPGIEYCLLRTRRMMVDMSYVGAT